MQIQKFLAIALVGNECFFTDASWEKLAAYLPGSKVTSHSAIDLDQAAIENVLAVEPIQYPVVKNIYERGGNSKTYAEFSVPALSFALSKGDVVVGATSGITGKMYSSYSKEATVIRVAYSTSDVQATYIGCKGGALSATPAGTTATAMTPYILTTGCFQKESLTITTASGTVVVAPTGVPTTKAGRTLQGFSTKAEGSMHQKYPKGIVLALPTVPPMAAATAISPSTTNIMAISTMPTSLSWQRSTAGRQASPKAKATWTSRAGLPCCARNASRRAPPT